LGRSHCRSAGPQALDAELVHHVLTIFRGGLVNQREDGQSRRQQDTENSQGHFNPENRKYPPT
jgi:hypothetical protein